MKEHLSIKGTDRWVTMVAHCEILCALAYISMCGVLQHIYT